VGDDDASFLAERRADACSGLERERERGAEEDEEEPTAHSCRARELVVVVVWMVRHLRWCLWEARAGCV
jgi:hypothetical protein